MKRTRLFLAALVIVFASFANSASFNNNGSALGADELVWNGELNKGLELAKQENKHVLVDMYTDWCTICKVMEKKTFHDPHVVKFVNKQFVCVKVNGDDNGPGAAVASKNDVHEYPTQLVFDSNGKLVGRFSGFRDAKQYEAELTRILSASK